MDPQKNVAQLVALSRHRKLCRDIVFIFVPQILSWPTVSIEIDFLCFLLGFFRDIKCFFHDSVLCLMFFNFVTTFFAMSR